ncbi:MULTISPECIES: SPOR domain-containing protein [Aequorivita]|uniref:SPOR domain-containing protein n=1 Tax=Aequorivita iocasae TaxID=2803865 RepID=A0ABX7DVK9_9FLAO|nr:MULTISPECIES: SPOR domain-containing protein [Aequorivita]QQX77752.1 SPOR domain-containing protein [Aequorivita iocasae]UCA57251.1 SPOR domain-containing protein [Aequorivita sp. F7]
MQLTTYIADLLYRYECVIVPGFGAFLTRYKSAQIDDATNTFHPPSKIVSFNKQLQANDGLFANYVASVEKCSYETALQRIRNFTAEISMALSEGKTISFKNIGTFSLNEEKSLQFEPLPQQNFSTSAFGLSSFVSPQISREVYKETVDAFEEKAPIHFTPEGREVKPYLKYAAIAVLAISAIGFGSLKLYENQVQKFNYAEREKANSLVENQIQEATFVIENPLPVVNLQVPKHTGLYHIVAGAYRMEENAEKKVSQLREKGYSPLKMEVNRYGLHQVLYASFNDKLEAQRKLYEIQKSENPDAWLLVQEIH